jgi:hypothetical protein
MNKHQPSNMKYFVNHVWHELKEPYWPGPGRRWSARGSALGVGEAASLLDGPSYGSGPSSRWVMLGLA